MELDAVAALFQDSKSFLITTHILPDGDGLGGELALAGYLSQLGKRFRVINSDPTPKKYRFLDPDNIIEVYPNGDLKLEEPDVIVLVDCAELSRIGPMGDLLKKFSSKIFVIDHHINENYREDEHFVDITASAIGEMLYRFFAHTDTEITLDMAYALYVSILTDTSSFRYARTTSLSHLIAAALIDIGVEPEATYQKIYADEKLGKMKLLGEVLNQIQTDCNGKLAWVDVSKTQRDKYRADAEDVSSFIDYLLLIDSAQIAVLFREEDDGSVKVSFRSRGVYDVYTAAQKIGGGGHPYSAGAHLRLSLKEVKTKVLSICKSLFEG